MQSMKKEYRGRAPGRRAALLTMLLVLPLLASCAALAVNHLKTEETVPAEVQGTYTLLFYGCRSVDDVENVAILDKEGDPFTFDIYAPGFSYKVKTGAPGDEALKASDRFIRCSFHFQQSRLSRIVGPSGEVVGYEVRPLYSPIRFGRYDVLDIHYILKGDRVVVYIKLDPTVERFIRDEGGDGRSNRDGK